MKKIHPYPYLLLMQHMKTKSEIHQNETWLPLNIVLKAVAISLSVGWRSQFFKNNDTSSFISFSLVAIL